MGLTRGSFVARSRSREAVGQLRRRGRGEYTERELSRRDRYLVFVKHGTSEREIRFLLQT